MPVDVFERVDLVAGSHKVQKGAKRHVDQRKASGQRECAHVAFVKRDSTPYLFRQCRGLLTCTHDHRR